MMYAPPGTFRAWAGIQKNGLADMKFVIRHGVLGRGGLKTNSTTKTGPSHEAKIAGGD